MSEELNNLRAATIKTILNSDNLNEGYIVSGSRKFTRSELAKEIENQTEVGNNAIKNLILLATDLVLRGKKEL